MTTNEVLNVLNGEITLLRNTTEAYEEVMGRIANADTIEDIDNTLAYIEDVKGEIGDRDYLRLKWLVEASALPHFIAKENA